MAENKKSIILYVDLIHTFEELSDDEAGRLIKHFLRYVNDLNPEPPDKLTKVVFEPIKQQLKRDLKKWNAIKKKRSIAGKASADKRQHVLTSVDTAQQDSTNPTVNDTVTVNVNDNVIVSDRENTGPSQNGTEKKYPIEECIVIAMKDSRWVKANKASTKELQDFNSLLEKRAVYDKNPADYKSHFASWKIAGKKDDVSNYEQLTSPRLRENV